MGEKRSCGKGIFFDVDDTLYDHLQPLREALRDVLGTGGEFPYEEVYHRFRYYSDMLSASHGAVNAQGAERDLQDMRVKRAQLALAEFGVHVTDPEAARIQQQYLERQFRITPFPGVMDLISDLQAAGHVVGLITNGPERHQMAKIKALAMDAAIPSERIFISGAVGYDKPDPRLFAFVNERTGTKASQSYYVGDSWRNDVVGALEAGWTAVWFNHRRVEPESEHQPHYTAGSYRELAELLLA
ncbi:MULTISPECIES: HAD family hydrolase [Paenibacillus]|uniref:Haloacid dehalogenase n=1 Tax=Paenibacillus albilobatus TaxID=2716884 RepID=A0A919XJ70_9BACL|nr:MULTISPECIES: HAD family hydrolase [Paenibacillus]GIO33902.1 haloacid dehalogenase [Paenibacillus albilobatus]